MYVDSSTLRQLGWSLFFDEEFGAHAAAGFAPARVAVQHRGAYAIYGQRGELWAELAGKMEGDYVRRDPGKLGFEARVAARLPASGDWIAASVRAGERRATIQATLPRRTRFSRKQPWNPTVEQVLAANIDTVFVVSALAPVTSVDDPPKLRRLERFVAMAHESGARPAILLTKADLRVDAREQARALGVLGVDVVLSSALVREGLDSLEPYFRARTDRRVDRLVRSREIDADQCHPGHRPACHAGGAPRRRGPAHDRAPRTHSSSRRRSHRRYAGAPRDPALGRGGRLRGCVRGYRRACLALSISRLRPRVGTGLRGDRRHGDRSPGPRATWEFSETAT